MAVFGTASPPMTAGAMMLMYQFAIALIIGLGPLFILCLMFDQTKELFRRWLLYGIGTIFAKAMLSVVSAMVLSLSARLSVAAWVTKAISLTGILSANAEGLTSQAMQTGGIGLILTVLLISVPPMAAMFFNGTMGQFYYASAFNSAAGQPSPSQMPGTYGLPPLGSTSAPGSDQNRSRGHIPEPPESQDQKNNGTSLGYDEIKQKRSN